MRRLLLIVLVVSATITSCEGFNLKQPAYIRFSWSMFNQNESVAHLTSGYFYLDKLEFDGQREEGPQVLLEQEISNSKISFSGGSNLGFSLDVPSGRYEQMKITLKPDGHFEPCMALFGEYRLDGEAINFRIEWDTAKDLLFDPKTDQIISRKKSYGATFGFDEEQLFQSVNWVDLDVEMIDDQPTAIISQTKNPEAFEAIATAMDNAFKMIIQEL